MTYRREFLKKVLMMARETRDHEIGCDDCWKEVDRFAELMILDRSPEDAFPLIEAHLQSCRECAEEFRALLGSLKSTTPRRNISGEK